MTVRLHASCTQGIEMGYVLSAQHSAVTVCLDFGQNRNRRGWMKRALGLPAAGLNSYVIQLYSREITKGGDVIMRFWYPVDEITMLLKLPD